MVKIDPKKHPKLVKFLLKLQGILKTVAIICFSLVLVLGAFFSFRTCEKDKMISASAEEVSLHSIYGIYIPSTVIFNSSSSFADYYVSDRFYFCYLYMHLGTTVYLTTTFKTKFLYDEDNNLYSLPNGIMAYYVHSSGEDLFSDIIFDEYGKGCLDSSIFKSFYFGVYHGNGNYGSSFLFSFVNFSTFDIFRFSSGEVSGEYDEGYNVGYEQGHNAGYNTGYDEGYEQGDLDGYLDGATDGYNNGYSAGETDGYAQGESDGYENGYTDGSANAEYGFFAGVTVSGTMYDVLMADGSETDVTFSFTEDIPLISGGIDFRGFDKRLVALAPEGEWGYTVFVLSLKNPVALSGIKLLGSGNSEMYSYGVTLYDTNGKTYYCSWEENGNPHKLILPDMSDGDSILVNKLEFHWSRGEDGLYNTVWQEGVGYYGGYSAGYNEGRDDGYDAGFDRGKEVSYDLGYSAGFQEGFNQSDAGGFNWLISSVQAFLDFNFFGDFGIGTLLYVGLGLVLATLFLKMFAGG